MTDQERLARQWAELVKSVPEVDYGTKANAAAEYILDHTAPPTMADTEWDDEKHRGLGAVDDAGQEWVMLQDDGGYINCVGLDLNPVGAERDELTPNGKRYKLVEVPDHPEVLETVEDYENAPEGTVVASGSEEPWMKTQDRWRSRGSTTWTDQAMVRNFPLMPNRRVLRWGWVE